MKIGVPKEIKDNEFRVAAVPSGVRVLVDSGHMVYVEKGAGEGSRISDDEYRDAGATVLGDASDVYGRADLIVKVKEPLSGEFRFLHDGLMIFTFFHLAANQRLASMLLRSGCTAIAYETLETDDGRRPVLTPMSEVAGKLAVHVGAHYLQKPHGGGGVLLGGVPGTGSGAVTIIGAGAVGFNAARVAAALGADVTVLNKSVARLRYIEDIFGGSVNTVISNAYNIERAVRGCDLLIGAVHITGTRPPALVTREMVSTMKKGSVIVDVSVDQGGCVESIHPTTHTTPTYDVDGVVHYAVSNMPGAVPETSTFALTNATIPYIAAIADLGLKSAVAKDPALARAVNIHKGRVTHPGVAVSIKKDFSPLSF
ncbi:MAG: alanine dehydrogenase [Thermodesulfobacteriota bacterium]|nr:MAG: alanine dehydrogenase [Thermodesulfobacteriota bacterium]